MCAMKNSKYYAFNALNIVVFYSVYAIIQIYERIYSFGKAFN